MRIVLFFLATIFLWSCNSEQTQTKENKVENDSTNVIVEPIDSLDYLTRQIQTDYNNPKSWANRAKYLISQGDLNNAMLDMQEVISRDTTTIEYRLTYADLLVAKLELEEAVKHYDYVLTVDSLNALAYVGLGRIYAYLDNPSKATALLDEAQKIDPYLPDTYYLEGMIYKDDYYKTNREESWNRALSSFQTVVEQNPKHYNAYISMGVMKSERGDDMAIDYFNSAIQVAPKSSEAWYNKGAYYQMKKDYALAKENFRSIIAFDSLFPKAYYNQGYMQLVVDKNYDSAIYFFNKAIDIDTLYFQAYNNLGLAYERNGDKINAKLNYQKALEINPDFELAKKNLTYVNGH
ncbi:MAG: tetratricopeptide repeat protein [Putridiphycobacter sp.]